MHIIFLIIFAFLVIKLSKHRNSNDFRIAVLSIFGINFFFIIKYIRFYAETFSVDPSLAHILILASVATTMSLLFFPFFTRESHLRSSILISLFVLFTSISFIFDKNIKLFIADVGGFFDKAAIDYSTDSDRKSADSFYFEHSEGGYSLNLPDPWAIQTHKSGLSFFEYSENSAVAAELRPKCFNNSEMSFVEIITSIEKHTNADERHCSKDQEFYVCLLKGRVGGIERWRWLAKGRNTSQAVELDFNFYNASEETRSDALQIIDSIKIGPIKEPTSLCINTIDWL